MDTLVSILFVLLALAWPLAEAQYDYDEVLHKSILFYEAQRSGYLPSTNRVPWRGDSALDDQGNSGEDLTGGWYDAGDHVKFGFPMALSVTTLAWGLVEFEEAYSAAGELDDMLDCIRWPLDYMIKAHVSTQEFYGQVGDGYLDHDYWGRPEEMTMDRPAWSISPIAPGSDLAGEAAAALAASSIAFRNHDSGYADTLLQHARELYDLAYDYRGYYSDSIENAGEFYRSSGYNDELAWGAVWLYRATGEQLYLDRAEEFYSSGTPWSYSWDEKNAGVQVLMYITTGQSQYQEAVERFITSWLPGGSVDYTPLGLAWRAQWGSLRYSANTALVAMVAAEYGIMVNEGRDFARGQIHYMLGDTGRSFVVGFGVNPPMRPHHPAASCPTDPSEPCDWSDYSSPDPNPNVLNGALVGGPDADDHYEDDRTNYITNEVTCDYNAGFQGAVAGLRSLQLRRLL